MKGPDSLRYFGESFWWQGQCFLKDTTAPVVVLGLKIASFTYGGMLGVFLLGIFSRHANQKDAMIGFVMGIVCTGAILKYTTIAFTWHGCIGCVVTLGVAVVSRVLRKEVGGVLN